VKNMDVFPAASRDGFTAARKIPLPIPAPEHETIVPHGK
jgi:hypothetical protein